MAAGSYTDPLQNRARNTADDLKDSARSMLGEQQQAVAGGLGDFAGALRKAAREMGDGREAPMSRVIESAAEGLERFSGSLRNKDFDGVVGDLESFARRQPVAFFGLAVAAGFLAVRFVKASSQRDGEMNLPY